MSARCKYIGYEISCLSFDAATSLGGHYSDPLVFATGSCGEGFKDGEPLNKVALWSLDPRKMDALDALQQVHSASHSGDVTDLKFAMGSTVLAASSNGSISVYRFNHKLAHLLSTHCIKGATCPITKLSVQESLAASVGEDGKLCVFDLNYPGARSVRPTAVFEDADACTVNAVSFSSLSQIATVNNSGRLRIWDLRLDGGNPVRSLKSSSSGSIPLLCVETHPNQPNIVATGSADGVVDIWDVRFETLPIKPCRISESLIWDVRFHPTRNNEMVCCSEDGSAFLLDHDPYKKYPNGGFVRQDANGHPMSETENDTEMVLGCDTIFTTNGNSALSCIDTRRDVAVAAADNHALYYSTI